MTIYNNNTGKVLFKAVSSSERANELILPDISESGSSINFYSNSNEDFYAIKKGNGDSFEDVYLEKIAWSPTGQRKYKILLNEIDPNYNSVKNDGTYDATEIGFSDDGNVIFWKNNDSTKKVYITYCKDGNFENTSDDNYVHTNLNATTDGGIISDTGGHDNFSIHHIKDKKYLIHSESATNTSPRYKAYLYDFENEVTPFIFSQNIFSFGTSGFQRNAVSYLYISKDLTKAVGSALSSDNTTVRVLREFTLDLSNVDSGTFSFNQDYNGTTTTLPQGEKRAYMGALGTTKMIYVNSLFSNNIYERDFNTIAVGTSIANDYEDNSNFAVLHNVELLEDRSLFAYKTTTDTIKILKKLSGTSWNSSVLLSEIALSSLDGEGLTFTDVSFKDINSIYVTFFEFNTGTYRTKVVKHEW